MRSSALLCLFALSTPGCGADYARVVVEGANQELTVGPVEIQVRVHGSAKVSTFKYQGRFQAPHAGLPQSDFVIAFEDGAGPQVDVRVAVPTATCRPPRNDRLNEA